MKEHTYVLVVDQFDPHQYPSYTWKWVPFKWHKLEHIYRLLAFAALRKESEMDNVTDPVEWREDGTA